MPLSEPVEFAEDGVRGLLHRARTGAGDAMVLTHGAGGDANAPLLRAVADAFAAAGVTVLRCDLPFRQRRPKGPPAPADAARDRAGLRAALAALRRIAQGRIFLGGLSYGGRQASLLAAEDPGVADALLFLSYPLHPPGKPEQLRIAHFPSLRTPALFVHRTGDPFGSIPELEAAIAAIPAPHELIVIDGAGHDLKRGRFDLSAVVGSLA
jgi:uncharacterized protein